MKRTETFKLTVPRRIGKEYPPIYEQVPVDIEVEVDFEAVARAMAIKAFRNKNKTSKLRVGVIVKATRR